MPGSPVRIVPMFDDCFEAAAETMARGFQNDPLFSTIWPDPEERATSLLIVSRWNLRNAGADDRVFVTADSVDGVAFGLRSDLHKSADSDAVSRLERELGPHAWQRFDQDVHAFTHADRELMERTPEIHWYLHMIAVAPEKQGLGIGSALIHALHACADADDLPTALVTFQPRNVPLYQRHGYQIVVEGTEPSQGLYYWGMKRPPHSSDVSRES